MYYTELQIEQMPAQLATAIRGNDMLRSELQSLEVDGLKEKIKDLDEAIFVNDGQITMLRESQSKNSKKHF